MIHECNGQCNKREVMSSDHHVIGSRFADSVNVINVTATDFYPPIHSLTIAHLNFRRVKYVFGLKVFKDEKLQ